MECIKTAKSRYVDGWIETFSFDDGSSLVTNGDEETLRFYQETKSSPLNALIKSVEDAEEVVFAEKEKLHAYLWPILNAYGASRNKNDRIGDVDIFDGGVHISTGYGEYWGRTRIPVEVFQADDPVAKAKELLENQQERLNQEHLARKRQEYEKLKRELGEE